MPQDELSFVQQETKTPASSKNLIAIEISSVENIASALIIAANKINEAVNNIEAKNLDGELKKFNESIKIYKDMELSLYAERLTIELKRTIKSLDFEFLRDEIFADTLRELKRLNGTAHMAAADVSAADEKFSKLSKKLSEKIDEFTQTMNSLNEIDLVVKSVKSIENLQKNYSLRVSIFAAISGLVVGSLGTYIYLIGKIVK